MLNDKENLILCEKLGGKWSSFFKIKDVMLMEKRFEKIYLSDF